MIVPDASLLYPQLSPYDDDDDYRMSSRSAPEMDFPRIVSQPSTPSWRARQYEPGEPHSLQMPRSPTFPPVSGRRRARAASIGERALTDDDDIRLFAEAISGLSPEQAYRQAPASGRAGRPATELRHGTDDGEGNGMEAHDDSPLAETPTTIMALQHLASIPQGAATASSLPSRDQRQQPSQSVSDADLWFGNALSSIQYRQQQREEAFDVSPIDGELPDYASSQAQVQSRVRVEAARRAQELQRIWQQSQTRGGG